MWVQFRHEHIRNVFSKLPKQYKEFQSHVAGINTENVKGLGLMLKSLPEYKKKKLLFATHLAIAEDCNNKLENRIRFQCEAEQDIALGADINGEPIRELGHKIKDFLDPDSNIPINDRLRMILLYIIKRNGVSEDHLNNLLNHGKIANNKQLILNLQKLGLQVFSNGGEKHDNVPEYRKERSWAYDLSRWTPLVKDIMEDAIEDKLSARDFKFLNRASSSQRFTGTSARSTWIRDSVQSKVHSGPRLIIFVIGGCTYSEMRCAYEVTKSNRQWEVLIGSDHVLTPKQFIKDLEMN